MHASATSNEQIHSAIKTLLVLRTEMAQRESNAHPAMEQASRVLRDTVAQMRQDVAAISQDASARMGHEAQQAVAPAAQHIERAVQVASDRLQSVNRTVWMWFAAAACLLMLIVLLGWMALGYYRSELDNAQAELARHESALTVVQAFYRSDAVLCGDRICVNIEPKAQRVGDNGQYRLARERPAQP